MTTAQRHESWLLFSSRPALWVLLRAGRWTGPVRRVPRVGWLVADPVLARRALGDHRNTSVLGEGGVGHLWAQVLGDWVTDLFDGSGHAALRARVRDVFTEASARAHVDRVLTPTLAAATATLRSGAELDVADLARVLTGRLVADLLGLPDTTDEQARTRFGTAERLASLALGTGASTHLDPATVATARELVATLTAGVAEGWAHAGEDRLLGRCRALGLGRRETEGLAVLMAVAGTGTAASAMARTVALVADTGSAGRLVAEPGLVPDAVREGLRVSTPAPVVGRHVTGDIALGSARLRAGDRLLVLTHTVDNAAGGFDLDRPYDPATRQLWFGAGRHQCLGSALAKAVLAALLRALIATGEPWRVTGRRAARRVLVPAYAELRIVTA
ncbi:cytochrome P450 [Actinomycetospora aeridis]|uniref:Cytochrome P450 n=1 Tax=Actinomycetospora aeridis TaxID=3129231 RepID=A0ABU8MYZ7_9PSEU